MKEKNYLTATELRSRIYRVIDEVAESGVEQEVRRGSTSVLIVAASPPPSRLRNLRRRKALNCTPDELIAVSWDESWSAE